MHEHSLRRFGHTKQLSFACQTRAFGTAKSTDESTLYEAIYNIDNLYLASKNALKGKRSKPTAAKYWFHEDKYVALMHQELKAEDYRFGEYTVFRLNDKGVERRISAAPFRDRVLHHAGGRFGHTKHLQPLNVLRTFGMTKPTKGIGQYVRL